MASFSLFNSIRSKKPKRNRFDLSHDVKTTAKFGYLTPIFCQPVLPGDTFKLNTEILCRFAPFQAPVMHNCKIYTHFFFVPNRLIWDNWKDFITGGEDGKDAPLYPTFTVDDSKHAEHYFCDGSLADYLGFPSYSLNQMGVNKYKVDALPFRAYSLIWNEYYRDQNLQDEIDIRKDEDGNHIISAPVDHGDNSLWHDEYGHAHRGGFELTDPLFTLKKRAWKKDYFTSALPFAQRGDDVELPLFGNASLDFSDEQTIIETHGPLITKTFTDAGNVVAAEQKQVYNKYFNGESRLGIDVGSEIVRLGLGTTKPTSGDPMTGVTTFLESSELKKMLNGVSLDNISSATVQELRRCIKAQEFLEAMARGGSRYIEQIYSIFGVRSSDARLQRPEFLGGGKSNVVISDVLQTSQTTDGNPLATPAGHGVSVQNTHSFKKFFEEHGYVIGIMSVMPMPAYQQGMPKVFTKFDRLDYYWPQFANLGEQEISQGELFYTGNENVDSKLFGYTPRYAEYKYIPDSVHGDFRGNLNFWHMGRVFNAPPALNADFITNVQDCANRPFSVQDSSFDKIWINIHHNLKAMRPMPFYGTPHL